MRYKRWLSKLKDIVEFPLVLLSCGFWMVLAFIRGQKIRYQEWRIRRLEAERDRYQRMTRDLERRRIALERRIAGDQ
jgi:hypothetical protein